MISTNTPRYHIFDVEPQNPDREGGQLSLLQLQIRASVM
jgi:hypothetical protein